MAESEGESFLIRRDMPEGSQAINLTELAESLRYLKEDNPLVKQAFAVARELDVWLTARDPLDLKVFEMRARSSVRVADTFVAVEICDETVWCSNTDSENDLTPDYCLDAFEKTTKQRMAYFRGSEA